MLTLLTLCLLQAGPFEGTFLADQGLVTLSQRKGLVRGKITLDSERVRLHGTVTKGVLVGTAIDGYRKKFTFRATLAGGVLSLTIGNDTIQFTRRPNPAAQRPRPRSHWRSGKSRSEARAGAEASGAGVRREDLR